ncbi:MAG: SEC-C domain-containing protein, partial [Sedimentisphaerales bacterium]
TRQGAVSKDQIMRMVNKILPFDSAISVHYRYLIINSLLGYPVEMRRRPYIGGGVPVEGDSGKKGIIFDVSPEEKTLNEWKSGNFTEAENILSEQWRESTRSLDLELFKNTAKQKIKVLKQFDSVEQLHQYVNKFLSQENNQTNLLVWLIEEFGIDFPMAQRVFIRWERGEYKLIKDFSPYAYYCFNALVLFYFGLICNFIGTRPTNKIDLEYIYYLPFCMVFVSNDNFHKSIAGTFLNSDQTFVAGEDLKADLKNLSYEWGKLGEHRKDVWGAQYGFGPPANGKSITFQLWKRFFPHWEPGGKRIEPKSSDDEAKLVERMKNLVNSQISKDTSQVPLDDSEADFVVRKREVSIYEPCPCGSGKKFKDCHWPKIKDSQDRSQ